MSSQMPDFKYKATPEQIHDLMMRVPAYQDVMLQEQPTPKYGMFHLVFNNRKKQGRGYQSHECMGVLYPEGNVHINTKAFHIREFATLAEMRDALEEWGDCWVKFEGVKQP